MKAKSNRVKFIDVIIVESSESTDECFFVKFEEEKGKPRN